MNDYNTSLFRFETFKLNKTEQQKPNSITNSTGTHKSYDLNYQKYSLFRRNFSVKKNDCHRFLCSKHRIFSLLETRKHMCDIIARVTSTSFIWTIRKSREIVDRMRGKDFRQIRRRETRTRPVPPFHESSPVVDATFAVFVSTGTSVDSSSASRRLLFVQAR